jgi:hypothetical protein
MFEAIEKNAQRLWELAQPMDHDLHIVAVEGYTADAEPLPRYAWPGPTSLRDDSDSAGLRSRVAAADAGPFRAIREQFFRDTRARFTAITGGIQMTEGDLSAAVFMRDALPYEDERGLWPLPGE